MLILLVVVTAGQALAGDVGAPTPAACVSLPGRFSYPRDFPTLLAASRDPASPCAYPTLLRRFLADEPLAVTDLLALQIGFTAQPAYDGYADLDVERELFRLNDEGRFKRVVRLGDAFLRDHPASLCGNLERAYAAHELGDVRSADRYLARYRALGGAALASGDGRTPETAYFALGPADGQTLARKFLGMDIQSMGSGFGADGSFVDIMTGTVDGATVQVYFNITHAEAGLRRELDAVQAAP